MSIIQTTFPTNNVATNKTQLLAWLEANATDYFDSYDTDGDYIICKNGESNVIKIWYTAPYGSGEAYGFTLYNRYGSSVSCTNAFLVSATVKTSKGIFIRAQAVNEYSIYNDIFISKAENGHIAIAAICFEGQINSHYDRFRCYDFEDAPSIPTIYASERGNAVSVVSRISTQMAETSLAKIPFYNTVSHFTDVYQLVHNQYYGVYGIINVDGVDYFTNGCIALGD